jgi:hypothetical protein
MFTRIFIGTGIGTPSADSADTLSADSADTVPIDFEVSALTKLLPNKPVLRISADSADTFTKFFMGKKCSQSGLVSRLLRFFDDGH